MTPFEQGYSAFMKCAADDGMDANTSLMAGGAATAAGGLGVSELSKRLPQATDAGRASLDNFMTVQAPAKGAPRADLENFLQDYTEKGHSLVGERVVTPHGAPGPITGRQFIEDLRTGTIPDMIGSPVKWGPNTAGHYDAFAESPQAALSKLIEETNLPHANPAQGLSELPDDVLQATVDHTSDKFKRYRASMPNVRRFLDAQPNVQRGGRLAAGLGLGALGLGAINKLRED